jgi:CRISPR-associated protein Csb2
LQRHTREHPPVIIAPKSKAGQAIRRFVPNNDGDKEFDRQERLTAKHTEPTLFLLEPAQKPEVHYIWDISDTSSCPINDIDRAARSLTSLGWGIDMAFADARPASKAEVQSLMGIRWYPKKRDWPFRDTLRTPTYDDDSGECTLCDLRHCHSTFVNRIQHGKPLKIVDKPKVFDRVLYTSTERPVGRPHVIFKLVDENDDTFRYPHAKLIYVAGMVRHLAIDTMHAEIGGPGLLMIGYAASYAANGIRRPATITSSSPMCRCRPSGTLMPMP